MLKVDDYRLNGSWLDEAQARFEAENDGLVSHTRSLLGRIAADAPLHGRFLNTLSLLEHIGSHKIMATQHGSHVDQATLKHVAEEAHHAYFMKRQAEKTAERPLEYVARDLVAPAAARMYFQRLEAALVKILKRQQSARTAYLYMSLIVEFRALWFYRLYEQTLKRMSQPLSLKRVLGEEQSHLGDVAHRLEVARELSDERVMAFLRHEKDLYRRLLEAMQRAVSL